MGQLCLFKYDGVPDFSSIKWHRTKTRKSYEDSENLIQSFGGRMLTLEEARNYLNNRGHPLYKDDQWCAISGRDWV